MSSIDLTCIIPNTQQKGAIPAACRELTITPASGSTYTAQVYDFQHDSMQGTYIDFPGHITATDDGQDAANWPLDQSFRVQSTVIHLDKPDQSGPVTAQELVDACPTPVSGKGLVINALGRRRFDAIEGRSVYLDPSALAWIVDHNIKLFVSDIYESKALHGVFGTLFAAGIATVCCPVNLHLAAVFRIPAMVSLISCCVRRGCIGRLSCRL